MITATRTRLLTYTAVALTSAVGFSTSAQAACTITANVLTCGTTTTTDTIGTGPNDRGYDFTNALTAANVSAGAVVDGYGLAIGVNSATVATHTFTNSGTIQVNAGNTPTVGSASALYLGSAGTNIVYGGAGNITNLGVGHGLHIDMQGAGTATATIGGNVRADAGDAIHIDGVAATGAIAVTTTAGRTIRASAGDGIDIDYAGTANVTVTNAAAISSGGAGVNTLQDGINVTHTGTAGNVSIANTGAIGSATDRAQLTGITSAITNAASAGTTSITGSGAIWSVGDGINASTAGTGAVTVNYTGAINTTGGDGIEVDTVNANISVTTGAGAVTTTSAVDSAINVVSTGTGNVAVTTGTGAITGGFNGILSVASTGTNSVTTGTGAVTGTSFGIQIVSNGVAPAAQTVTVGGAVTGTGAGSSGIRSFTDGARTITVNAAGNVTGVGQAIELVGLGTTTITNNGIIGGTATGLAILDSGGGASTITNAATGTLNGVLSLGGGADVVANAGLWNVSGNVDFGAGTDRLQNTGRITLAGNTTLLGLESIGSATVAGNAGRIDLGTFTLTGPAIVFTNNATGNVTTSGNATLAGFTSVANAGTFTLGAGTLTVPAGTFTNTGSVIARSGASTITGQTSFLNSGGQLLLNDGAANDTLTINSSFTASGNSRLSIDASATAADRLNINGNVTGTTTVIVTPVAGTVGFDTAGILIVDVTGGTAPANAFATTSLQSTLVGYTIEQRGTDFFLLTIPTVGAFAPVMLGNLVVDNWYTGAEAFNAMAAARGGGADEGSFSVWVQPLYASERYGDTTQTINAVNRTFTIPTRTRITRQGVQGGVDFNAGMAVFGITGGYSQAEFDSGSPTQPVVGSPPLLHNASQTDGWNIGAYAMVGGPVGIYGNALIKYDSNNVDLNGGAFEDLGINTDGNTYGIDGEVGYRSGTEGMSFEVLGGLSYVNAEIDDFDAGGITYRLDGIDSLRGRVGARAVFNQFERLFVGAKLLHEFSGDTDLLLDSTSDAAISNEGRGTWGRLEAGIGGSRSMPFNISAFHNVGDVKGWGVTGGLRLSFGGMDRVEMAPPPVLPPPPPPVEPAPAVEPAPPPPPPPPAPGERG